MKIRRHIWSKIVKKKKGGIRAPYVDNVNNEFLKDSTL